MTLGSFANFNGIIKQVGHLTGPSEIVNGSSFVRDDGRLLSVGMGNRVILYLSTFFTDYSIFSDPDFEFMGLTVGWGITDVDPETDKDERARTFEENSQVAVAGVNPFDRAVYIQPEITISDNPSFDDTKMSKLNWDFLELPYDNPNVTSSGSPASYATNGLVVPLVALGDYMRVWIRLIAAPGWSGFNVADKIQLDVAIGANAQ